MFPKFPSGAGRENLDLESGRELWRSGYHTHPVLKNIIRDLWSAVAKFGKIHIWNLLSSLETRVVSDGAFGVLFFSVPSQILRSGNSVGPEFSILLFWEYVQRVLLLFHMGMGKAFGWTLSTG